MLLTIHNIECYAYHGCLPEERKIGQLFSVDVEVLIEDDKSLRSDNLSDTADYVLIHNVVRSEMSIPSNLIENVAWRILQQLKLKIGGVKSFHVKVHKYNPPVNGQIEKVTVMVQG